MKKTALITFHGSYNFGSVLQAYATQTYLKKIGIQCDIINYRMKSQKQYYSLFQINYGVMRFTRNILLIPILFKRKKRAEKFENFINGKLILTNEEYSTNEELRNANWNDYGTFISGGDQIWNPWVPEVERATEISILPYFLDFVHGVKKISYATSIGVASTDDIVKYVKQLDEYKRISTRENIAKKTLEDVTHKSIDTVLDPVFLLSREEWKKLNNVKRIIEEPYLLLYTLQGIRTGRKWVEGIRPFAKKQGLRIVCISPFFPVYGKNIKNIIDVGPEQFINLLENAECVCTDSFHGTVFSIIFEKSFYTANKEDSNLDYRKTELLNRFGLESHLLSSIKELSDREHILIDYTKVNKKIKDEREKSMQYLKEVLYEK